VPGEDLAWPIPLAVLVVATTSAGAASSRWTSSASRWPPCLAGCRSHLVRSTQRSERSSAFSARPGT